MKSKIESWRNRIDEVTNEFKKNFSQFSEEKMNFKPNIQTWSIAQNINHLIVTNSSYFPIIEKIRTGNYRTGCLSKFSFINNFFGNLILGSVKADRKRKIKTFPVWEPGSSNFKDILNQFEEHQNKLKKLITESEDLLMKGQVVASPANKNISYKLELAFEIMVNHEFRHLEQAKGT
jgi:hypothetical protein